MAWAIVGPSGFGKYFPRNDFVGWEDHLQGRLKNLAPEVKETLNGSVADYCYRVSEAFKMEVKNPSRPNSHVRMPSIDELPQEVQLEGTYTDLAAMFMVRSGMLVVEERLRKIIETLEPGVHFFWPVRLTTTKGRAAPNLYFGLIIGRFLESFDLEATPADSVPGTDYQRQVSMPIKKVIETLVLRADQIGHAHLWRERRLIRPEIFLSDTLQAEIARANLSIPKHFRLKEI